MSKNEVFDKRTVARKIKRAVTTQEDYDSHIDSLEDCADQFEMVEAQFIRRSEAAAQEEEDSDSSSSED